MLTYYQKCEVKYGLNLHKRHSNENNTHTFLEHIKSIAQLTNYTSGMFGVPFKDLISYIEKLK